MAGFFGLFDYSKPGKGVSPDAPKKHAFLLFFELLWRKFSRFIVLNLMYFICILPIIAFVYTRVFLSVLQNIPDIPSPEDITMGPLPSLLTALALALPSPVFYTLLVISVALFGPATCGFTYIMRNYAREEHAWFSDFFARLKSNFRQGLVLGILEVLIYGIFILNITMRIPAGTAGSTFGMTTITISKYVSFFLVMIFTFMRHYLYTLAVTFDLSNRNILKNSLIFAVLGIFRNVLVTAVILATAFALLYFGGWTELLLLPLFAFSFWGFLTTFTCYPVIKKYMKLDSGADD